MRYGLNTLPNSELYRSVRYGTLNYAGVFGTTSIRTGTRHFRKFGPNSIPVPDISSVRTQYRYPDTSVRIYRGYTGDYLPCRSVRYNLNTGTRHGGKFGATLIPVPDTSVRSVRTQYPTEPYRSVRYGLPNYTGVLGVRFEIKPCYPTLW